MSSTALNFVLDNPNGAADRIEKLEAALRWIVKSCDVRIHRLSLFDEIQNHARAALAAELPKTILDEPTSPPEQE